MSVHTSVDRVPRGAVGDSALLGEGALGAVATGGRGVRHAGMVGRVRLRDVPEGLIVGAGRVLGGVVARAGRLVVRVVGHQVAAVHVGADDEGVLHDELHDGFGLGLHAVVEAAHGVHQVVVPGGRVRVHDAIQVGEVAVQVNVVGVRATHQEVLAALRFLGD